MNELKHLFLNTFVVENRYLYFLNGLGNTLLLTFSSFLLGTALGVVLCAGMRSGSAAVRRVAGIIKSFFVQLPTMVLLMIMVYVIFGRSKEHGYYRKVCQNRSNGFAVPKAALRFPQQMCSAVLRKRKSTANH